MTLRPTHALGAAAIAATTAAAAIEYAHVWHRGNAPTPSPGRVMHAGRIAARETVDVARQGYRAGSARENTLLNMLLAFSLTFGGARATTHAIHRWGTAGPLGHMRLGENHIHHLVPGIVIALVTGAATILTDDEQVERWLAIPFGAGAALTLDEAALLIQLEDVYWSEEGLLSVQLALTAMGLLASAELTRRLVKRGEQHVLASPGPAPRSSRASAAADADAANPTGGRA